MNKFGIIALTPPGLFDPAIAIAASRAGDIGVLDLEHIQDPAVAKAALRRLTRYGLGRFGLKLDGGEGGALGLVIDHFPDGMHCVVLSGSNQEQLVDQVKLLRNRNTAVFWESHDLDQALWGVEAGVDGLIAKGNEAGGWVGRETTFILLQRLLKYTSLPVWVQGGIGLHTAAGCYAAGAAGVVLDSQLLLTKEANIPEAAKMVVAGMDGSESVCLGEELRSACRVFVPSGPFKIEDLRETVSELVRNRASDPQRVHVWRNKVRSHLGWTPGEPNLWFLGQDVASARRFGERYVTVAGVLEGVRRSMQGHVALASREQPFNEGSPLAASHGTRYPIVQGPMARVSDRVSFAAEVASAGGLPFLAVGYMSAGDLESLLVEAKESLGDFQWGVGVLGFLPAPLRREQMAVISRFIPPFAIIAGGRPDQVQSMEQDGIKTYVHVPSPGLLDMHIRSGTRRFIFEGQECGGHVGPRSSFVLWECMTSALLDSVRANGFHEYHVLFAGGIHDGLSSSVAAAIGAPLAEKGVKIGLLMGTAYLFTAEAVSTGAILETYQQEALRCEQTVLLESGPGHAVRCTPGAYAARFDQEKQRLFQKKKPPEEVRKILEKMNQGRLRVASKGVKRNPGDAQGAKGSPALISVDEAEQRTEGLYMIGQLAALRAEVFTIDALHKDVCLAGSERLDLLKKSSDGLAGTVGERPSDIAIVGMACLMPKASSLQRYWENILYKVCGITEVPEQRWNWRIYFEQGTKKQDKFYSKWGGFLDPTPFDPMRYGMPPNSLRSIEPLQLLTLETVTAALEDAGYGIRPFARERTSIIVGASGGLADLGQRYAFRAALPTFFENVPQEVLSQLPEWTEDSFPGTLGNVAAGRIANRLDFGGANYAVDAACASSLAAVYMAVMELEAKTSDLVFAAAADTFQNPHFFFCFSKTHALSPTGRCRTFDREADGTCISEGIAVVALKRLGDAERDGDRIYGVIKGVGSSSDGRHKGLTAPHPEGQARALNRAYAKSGFSPSNVSLIEAHGTGTVAGDRSEIETLRQVFQSAGAKRKSCALGSVKSITGHTKSAAGLAGLIKVALALHHKVLPPTIGVENPNPSLLESPFYVNTELRPWIHGAQRHPRRAGVSSFGFGGTNFHAVVEEYTNHFLDEVPRAVSQRWPSELYLFSGSSRKALLDSAGRLARRLEQGAAPRPAELACALWKKAKDRQGLTLAVVAETLDDLREKLGAAMNQISETGRVDDPRGMYFSEKPLASDGKIAFLFPGQGSQHPDMLRELTVHFPEVRQCFDLADRTLEGRFSKPLSGYVFPPPRFSTQEAEVVQKELTQTNVAQPSLAAAAMGVFRLLGALKVVPAMAAGHSSGEYAALCAAGVFSEQDLYRLTEARGRFIMDTAGDDMGAMAAVKAGHSETESVIASIEDVWTANLNAPAQTIISGRKKSMREAVRRLEEAGMQVRPIPVSCAFHSPVVAPARELLAAFIATVRFERPRFDVFSNTTGGPYPETSEDAAALLSDHLVSPVRFVDEIEHMFDAGARIFVEVGPRNVLTGLTRQILAERPCLAVAADSRDRTGVTQLNHLLGQLASHGVRMDLGRLYKGRATGGLRLDFLAEGVEAPTVSPTTWMVTGGAVWPHGEGPARVVEPFRIPAEGTADADRSAGSQEKGAERVMLQFLETQREVMKAYLAGEVEAPNVSNVSVSIEALDKATTGIGPEFERRSAETDGIAVDGKACPKQESCDRAIRAKETPEKPAGPPAAGLGPDVGADIDPAELKAGLVRIVSERTGYPEDMIDLDLRLDADLGIDSIKWVEILGMLQESYLNLDKEKARSAMEELSEITTLRGVLDWFSGFSPAQDTASGPAAHPLKPSLEQQIQSPANREDLTKKLLRIVSERTGYPEDMIDLDLRLDADLGIDSIKWVEILGAFQEACLHLNEKQAQLAMEALAEISTLRGVIDWFEGSFESESQQKAGSGGRTNAQMPLAKTTSRSGTCNMAQGTARFVLSTSPRTAKRFGFSVEKGAVFVITDDGRGIAQEVADGLKGLGARVALVRIDKKVKKRRRGVYTADLTDYEQVEKLIGLIRRKEGNIAGIVHLLPLRVGVCLEEMALDQWRKRLREEVKSLFYFARAAGQDLKRTAKLKKAWFVAATGMGGAFGVGDTMPRTMFTGQAGTAGIVKTLSLEWPEVICRVVDLDPTDSIPALAERIRHEMSVDDTQVEVGYRGSQRLGLVMRPAPLGGFSATESGLREKGALAIDSDWVFLVTGGARGITARVTLDVARRYRPTIVVVGKSPFPEEETGETAALSSVEEIKSVMIERLRRQGNNPTPRQVDDKVKTIQRNREIRDNLAAMREFGAKVEYYRIDVRDSHRFGAIAEQIYEKYGRIDGLIHGAGVIEDKLVEHKSLEAFDRVFDTKVDSAFVLAKQLPVEALKVVVFFSSIAGYFGNRGQSDYAAANEVLNKLAAYLDANRTGRAVAIGWNPWANGGMATPEIQKQFAGQGIHLIQPSVGVRMFDAELRFGRKGESQVVIGDGPWNRADSAVCSIGSDDGMPLLGGTPIKKSHDGGVEVAITLDPEHEPYLRDHQIDGKAVFPFAVAMELMTEVVQQGWPGWIVTGMREVRRFQGVVFDGNPREIRVAARPESTEPAEEGAFGVDVTISGSNKESQPYYRAVVDVAGNFPAAPEYDSARLSRLDPFPMGVDEAYRQWLFHGPCLQGIARVDGFNDKGLLAMLRPSVPSTCLKQEVKGRWLVDPVVIDSAFQLSILWERAHYDMTFLISKVGSYRRFGSFSERPVQCWAEMRAASGGHLLTTDFHFVDESGRVIAVIAEMEGSCSKKLNRIVGHDNTRA